MWGRLADSSLDNFEPWWNATRVFQPVLSEKLWALTLSGRRVYLFIFRLFSPLTHPCRGMSSTSGIQEERTMRPKLSMFLLAAIPCSCASLQTLAAQGDPKEISPLILTGQFSQAL